MRVRSMRVTNSPGNSSSGKMRGAWSRGTRVESSTSGGAEESGRWIRVGLCVCQRDRRAGDRCTRVRVHGSTHLDGLHGFWMLVTTFRALCLFPSAPVVPERPSRRLQGPDVPSASDDGYDQLYVLGKRSQSSYVTTVPLRLSVTFTGSQLHSVTESRFRANSSVVR